MDWCCTDWASQPTPPLQNVSAPQCLHLPCPLTSRSHRKQRIHPRSTAWMLASLGPQDSRRCQQLFLNLTLGTCDGNYSCRFPRISLHSALSASHRTGPRRTPFTPFIKFIPSSTPGTVLVADRSFLADGMPSWINKLSLVFSFLSSCSTRQRTLTNLSSAGSPADPMRAPDSRPSISVLPSAPSGAYRAVTVISHVSTEVRLRAALRVDILQQVGSHLGPGTASVPPKLTGPVEPWAPLGRLGRHDTRVEHVFVCCIVSPCKWIKWASGLVRHHISVRSAGLVTSSLCMSPSPSTALSTR